MTTLTAIALRERALAAAAAGDIAAGTQLFEQAVAAAPSDPALLNSAGSFFARTDAPDTALKYFERALEIAPLLPEAALNRAITLSKLGRHTEAVAFLRTHERDLSEADRYWSIRAAAELATGDRVAAAVSYDRALVRAPANPRALHGRARVALERGEPSAVTLFERALPANPGDPQAWLGYAQALDAEGRTEDARRIAEQLVAQAPQWTEALELLAALRWAMGDGAAFCDHYRQAADAVRTSPIYASWAKMLAGVDDVAGAAAAARLGRSRCPDDLRLMLTEAVHLGVAGEDDAAESLFAALQLQTPERWLHEARHWLRRREPDRAETLLARVIGEEPDNVGAWALRDVSWRLTDDPRHYWLHGREEMVRLEPLEITDGEFDAAVALLDRLHDAAPAPVGQSVRRGTQTRGGLFDRAEPELAPVRRAIEAAVDRYRLALLPADSAHPLLRHRDRPWRLTGSWSIRLFGGGHHVAHIHPLGVASSAAYLVVPEGGEAGALELGRSPPDLRLDLPPLTTMRPRPRHCALFPSTLYHGTRTFETGKRLTVAFDLQVA